MDAPVAFESSWKKKELKEQIQENREKYINKLKIKHGKEERKREQARIRGEDVWMLDSVTERLQEEKRGLEKAMKKKKEKKHKKDKKKHKKKRKKNDNSSSESDTAEEKEIWSEKATISKAETSIIKGPNLQRDSWMLDPLSDFGTFPSITKTEFNEQRQKEKDSDKTVDEKTKQMFEEPGQHERELNPYWKEGGTGLPEAVPSKKKKMSTISVDIAAGDGGADWWQRAYQRCVEQAKEQGKTLEDVAAERYGSLKNLEAMLAAATKNERKLKISERQSDYGRYSKKYDPRNRMYNDQSRERASTKRQSFRRPDVDNKLDDVPRTDNEHNPSYRSSPSRWKKQGFLEPTDELSTKLEFMERKRRFIRPEEDTDRYEKRKSEYERQWSTPRWKKEHSSESRHTEDCKGRIKERDNSRDIEHTRSRERWTSEHNRECTETGRHRKRKDEGRDLERNRKDIKSETKQSKDDKYEMDKKKELEKCSTSGSSSTEDSSSSSSSENEAESESSNIIESTPKILTEQELNELGAKMVKAELMGNEELAAQIKAEIQECRKVQEMHVKSHPPTDKMKPTKEKNTEEVLLTMTDRYGNVRPIPAREHDDSGGRRRKQKIKTHSQGGSRERYFHDDDNKDLKSLVEQERLGTAEDSNYQFIKLAGKAFAGRQGLEDMDEVFMEGASKKTSDAKLELKERSQAIAEHRKMSAAMERCQFCFDKVPKHLIIAIGLKVYLCLPNHRSITEGHCLIVPMQHLTQSTCIDEDIFEEIQVFRRALTKMYETQNLDCVFMETCKDLHRHQHMVIECIPLPRELGDVAPIYFKKAIQESESEWSQNKKVVDLNKKNIRNAVPKGFPYFAVNFGLQGGFAHVIEEEKSFPYYFGREILGGMLDLEPALWRKPHRENFDEQRKKVLAFANWWKPVDWTQKLKAVTDSD